MYTFKQRRNRKYVFSTILYFMEYDEESQVMKIGFNDGVIGYFKDVPNDLYKEFKYAKSKGNFFYKHFYKSGYENYMKTV